MTSHRKKKQKQKQENVWDSIYFYWGERNEIKHHILGNATWNSTSACTMRWVVFYKTKSFNKQRESKKKKTRFARSAVTVAKSPTLRLRSLIIFPHPSSETLNKSLLHTVSLVSPPPPSPEVFNSIPLTKNGAHKTCACCV